MGFLTAPSTVLSIVLATILAALFHLWRGKKAQELLIYWPAAVLGFLIGQFVGARIGLDIAVIGETHIIEGSVLAIAAMFVANWLKL
jgi:hypothetical protein